jgi:GNAT superfamily N-acetyltransferase
LQGAIRFERVIEADATAFYQLRRDSILAGCAGHYSHTELEAWTNPQFDAPLGEPLPRHFYFAKIDGRIVACGMLDVTTGRIDAVFVLPPYFGRGIATAMMQHLECIAREHGLKSLTLDATLNAVSFYRSQGFQGNATSTCQSARGIALECVPMIRPLEWAG